MTHKNGSSPLYDEDSRDTVSAEFEVTDKRTLESRDDAGLVVVDSEMTNQDGESVFAGDMKFLFRTKNAEGVSAEP